MEENKHTIEGLKQMQALPLDLKIRMTQSRIKGWVDEYGVDGVYVSFSGGKDSTVLLDIVRDLYPDVKAMYVDTGLEYPEIRDFVKTFPNVDWLKPKMNFKEVITKYGYPFISKEVSECVEGARKYLTRLINEGILDRQTDRQTDLINTHTINLSERENTVNFQSPSLIQKLLKENTLTQLGGVHTLLPIRNKPYSWNNINVS